MSFIRDRLAGHSIVTATLECMSDSELVVLLGQHVPESACARRGPDLA